MKENAIARIEPDGTLSVFTSQAPHGQGHETTLAQIAADEMGVAIENVRVYHGDQTQLPRHYVARERLRLRATADYWINAMDGQPFLYINKEVDPGMVETIKKDVIPWLESNVAKTPEQQQSLRDDARAPWFTMVFDREGYSPELFEQLWNRRIAVLTYHKFPQEPWAEEEFRSYEVRL